MDLSELEARSAGLLGKSKANWDVGQQFLQTAKGNEEQPNHATNVAAGRLYYGVLESVIAYAVKHCGYVYDPHGKSVHSVAHDYVQRVMGSRGKGMLSFAEEFDALKNCRAKADYEENDVELLDLNDELMKVALNIRERFVKEARKAVKGSGKGQKHGSQR